MCIRADDRHSSVLIVNTEQEGDRLNNEREGGGGREEREERTAGTNSGVS